IAIREVGAMVQEEPEAAVAELIAIPLQIVAAKLIDHNDHNQFGMPVVGRCRGRDRALSNASYKTNDHEEKAHSGGAGEGSHCEGSLHRSRAINKVGRISTAAISLYPICSLHLG